MIVNLARVGGFWGENFKKYPIFILFFIDTIHNIFKFDSFVFINNKSLITIYYFYFVFLNFIESLTVLKKIKFFKKVRNKFMRNFTKSIIY